MKLLYRLTDEEFPYVGINHVRDISRGVIYNDNKEIALIHLYGDDSFGHRDYYETPGGGKEKGETNIECLIREIKEELGASIDNIKEIGRVVDYYNQIKRENNNHFYLAHVTKIEEKHLNDYEKTLMESIVWVPLDKVIEVYTSKEETKISRLVMNRELPILRIAIKMIKNL